MASDDTLGVHIELDVGGANAAADQFEQKLRDKIPDEKKVTVELDDGGSFAAVTRDIQQQTDVLAELAQGHRAVAAALEIENQLRARGRELTEAERAALTELVGLQQEQAAAVTAFREREAAQERSAQLYQEEIAAINADREQIELLAAGRRDEAEAIDIANRLAARGVQLTQQEYGQIHELVAARNQQRAAVAEAAAAERAETGVLERIRGPMHQYQSDLQALNALLHKGQITQQEFNSELRNLKAPNLGGAGGGGGFVNAIKGNFSNLGEQAAGLFPAATVAGGAFAIENTIEKVVELGSEYANLQNKLRQVTTSESDLTSTQKALTDISNETGTSVGDVVTIYQRTRNAVSELGISSSQTKDFVGNLSKLIAVSGANATEASQGLIQLSQGLGRGTLQGQDLKAVLEDVPAIGKSIAAGLGVPFAKLKEMGEQGQLTTKQVFDAIQSQSGAIDEAFGKRIPTVEQAMTKLHNTMLEIAGSITKGLGPALNDIAEKLQQVGAQLGPLVADLAQFFGKLALPQIEGFVHFLSSSAEYVHKLGDAFEAAGGPAGKFFEKLALTSGFENLATLMDRTVNATHSLTDAARDSVVVFRVRAANAKKEAAEALAAAQAVKDVEEGRAEAEKRLVEAVQSGDTAMIDSLQAYVLEQIKSTDITKEHQKELDKLADTLDAGGTAQRKYNEYVADLIQLEAQGKLTQEQVNQYTKEYAEANDAALDPLGHISQAVADHIAALQGSKQETLEMTLYQKYLNQALKGGEKDTDDLRTTIEALAKAEADAIKTSEKHNKARQQGAKDTNALWKELFPQIEAERELAEAERILDGWVRKGRLSKDQASEALVRYKRAHEELLNPVRAYIRGLNDEIAATKAVTDKEKEDLEIKRFLDEQAQKGIAVTREEVQLLRAKIEQLREAKKVQEEGLIQLPTVPAIGDDELAKHSVALSTWKAATQDAYDQYLANAAAAGDATAAFALDVDNLKKEILDTSVASHFMTDVFKEAVTDMTTIVDDFGAHFHEMLKSGEFDWKGFGDSVKDTALGFTDFVLKQLEQIFVKLALIKLIGSIAPGLGGGAFGEAADTIHLLGFAGGGRVTFGGDTGVDRNIFAARVSRGERLTIETQDQVRQSERAAAAASGGGGGSPSIFNIFDPSTLVDANNTPKGQRVIMNVLRVNPDLVRALQR